MRDDRVVLVEDAISGHPGIGRHETTNIGVSLVRTNEAVSAVMNLNPAP